LAKREQEIALQVADLPSKCSPDGGAMVSNLFRGAAWALAFGHSLVMAQAPECLNVNNPGAGGPTEFRICLVDVNGESAPALSYTLSAVGEANLLGQFYMEPSVVTAQNREYFPGERVAGFTGACLRNGSAEPNCPVRIEWFVLAETGAHESAQHANRPRGRVNLISPNVGSGGEVQAPAGSGSAFVTANTGSAASVSFRYAAPEAAGITRLSFIGYYGTPQQLPPLTVDIHVQIDDLVGRTGYVGRGGGQWFMKTNSGARHGNQNYFGRLGTLERIDTTADLFAQTVKTSGAIPTLMINDISLPLGGLYDLEGTWRPYHVSHRRGEAVDFRIVGLTLVQKHALGAAMTGAGFVFNEAGASPKACPTNAPCYATHFHGTVRTAQLQATDRGAFE
jgi:hypothetical protein